MKKIHKNIIVIDEEKNIQLTNDELNSEPKIKILEIMPSFAKDKKYLTYTDIINDKDNVKLLDMSKKEISKLPNNFSDLICKLNQLTELHLNDNNLDVLPTELFSCTNIKKLDLSNNLLCENSTEYIFKLINLQELNLSNCGDYSLNICYLTNLTKLNISNNYSGCHNQKLKKYLNLNSPTGISLNVYGQIGEKILNLNLIKETTIPKNINNLLNLTCLTIDSCELKLIPDEILLLSNLTQLSLNDNKLSSIPDKILLLNKLTHLSLNSNKFTSLPKIILSLDNLTYLMLEDNDVKVIPTDINKLVKLTHFNIENNLISIVPEEILKNMKNLKVFGIGLNPLVKMSSLLWNIPGVTELDLRKINIIPEKNNDLDMKIIVNSKTKIPDKITTVQIFISSLNKTSNYKILNNIPNSVDNLIIICNGAIKLDNLPPSLKTLVFVDYVYNDFKWIKQYIEKQYIKLPFGCEVSHKYDRKYQKRCNQL